MARWSKKVPQCGVIAEDTCDVDVLRVLTLKAAGGRAIAFKKCVGRGCGKLRRKCKAFARNLLVRGCTHVIVLHDLDAHNETELRRELTDRVKEVGFEAHIVLIPVRTIEAWLLADGEALRDVFGLSKAPEVPSNPEAVLRPKARLRDIIWRASKTHYVSTLHNVRIAAASRIERVSCCRSFREYPAFVAQHLCART